DTGLRLTFFDAAGNLIETLDSKGAVSLRAYDRGHRITHLWARDALNEPLGLTEQIEYGDGLVNQNIARARNLRGKLYQHQDEAGAMFFEKYDFKGNLTEKVRRIVAPAQLD